MWVNKTDSLPDNGTIVIVKTKRTSCMCSGFDEREVYYDNGIFQGIKNPKLIDKWKVSPANYLIKELEKRKCFVAADCANCLN